jgi:PAS domain S-box-containing protein
LALSTKFRAGCDGAEWTGDDSLSNGQDVQEAGPMKQLSIRQYVAWLTLVPLLFMAVSLESFFLQDRFTSLDADLAERGHLIARQLASGSEYGVFSNNMAFLQNIAQGVLQEPDVQGVLILDAASDVLIEAGTFPGAPGNATTPRIGKLKESVNSQTPVHRNSEGLLIYRAIFPAQVVLDDLGTPHQAKQIGAVIVAMSSARTGQLKSQLLLLTVAWTVLFLVFPFSLIYAGSRNIVSPISKLSEAVRALGDGRLETRASVSTRITELETLTRGINDMAAKLQQENDILLQRTDKLTEAQRIAHLGNWEWDIVNNTLIWSDEIYHIFGLSPQQVNVTYDVFLQAVHPEDRQSVMDCVREAVEQGHPYSMDHRILLPDGSLRYVHEQGEVSRNDDGQPAKMVGTVLDITVHKLAEETIRKLNDELETKVQERTKQLLEAQEEMVRKEKLAVLGQVAGSVGHELRNPLGVMNNAVYFLQAVLTDADDSVKEYLNIIKSEIASSERIVSDLLDSVRTKPPHPEVVGLAELIDQTLRKSTIPPSVTVKLDIPETLPPLWGDAMQIHQVLRNLISNGVEAMPEGGTLEIRAEADEEAMHIAIGVRDSGTGMTTEQLGKLFQPLYTTKARGIGLGLVVVKNLTQANGGTVEVRSEAGKGSLFLVTLPAADKRG